MVSSQPSRLLSLLHSGAERSLLSTGDDFKTHYDDSSSRFRALCTLLLLLEQNAVGSKAQRIAGHYLLSFTYDWQAIEAFPFLRFFIEVAGNESTPREERAYLQTILSEGPSSLQASTPREIIQRPPDTGKPLLSLSELRARYPPADKAPAPSTPPCATTSRSGNGDRATVKQQDASAPRTPPAARSAKPNSKEQKSSSRDAKSEQRGQPAKAPEESTPGGGASTEPSTSAASSSSALSTLMPRFVRVAPPIMDAQAADTAWVQLSLQDSLVWDDSAEVLPSTLEMLQKLVVDAQLKPLAPLQQKRFLAALEAWPRLVQYIGVSPTQLPALVEHNNMIAVELLLKLMDINSPRISAFLDVLVHMDLSVHSMEVVKRLTGVVSLPMDFVHMYISSCIQSCETIEQKNLQNRLVRLVCVFLQSLIRTKIIDVKAVQYEVLSFCVNFSRIREAASLFRLLQNMSEQEAGGGSFLGSGGDGPA